MTHTIILLVSRTLFKDLDINTLIHENIFLNGLMMIFYNDNVKVDYFGLEIDNQADFIDEELQKKMDENFFIQIYFENEKLEYDKYTKREILDLAINLIEKNRESIRVSTNGTDIDVYV